MTATHCPSCGSAIPHPTPPSCRYCGLSLARLERSIALVADERTEVSGGGKDSSASTSYHVLLEWKEGQRRELKPSARVTGAVAPGDIGVAYVKANRLLDFRRIPV